MLQNMRQASKSWIMRAFFAILVFAFVILWGVGDVFRPGRLTDHSIATVGNTKISMNEFKKATSLLAMQQQQQGQQMDEKSLRQAVLQNLVTNALLDQEADHLGLAISDQQIVELVRAAPPFQDKNGQFSKQIFDAVARSEGMTTKEFEEDLRKQMRRNQLIQLVSTGMALPQTYLTPLLQWQYEKREVDWASIQPSSFNKLPAPTPEELHAYYEGHKEEFTKPEERDITLVILSEPTLRSKVKLTDEELQAGFAAHRGDIKGTLPTKAETEKITEDLKAEKSMDEFNQLSTAIQDNLAGGLSLEELAKKHDMKLVKVEGLKKDGAARKKADISPEALIETIEQGFKMSQGEEPFLSQLGSGEYIAVRLDKVYEPKLLPFEEVSKEIEKIVTTDHQHEAAKELATSMVEKINKGAQLTQLAKEHNLPLKTGVILNRSDKTDKTVPLGIRNVSFQVPINSAGIAPGENGTYAVVVPRKIINPKPGEIKEDEAKALSKAIENNLTTDMFQQYMESLERRYKVELNKSVMESLQK